jgi:hypothetical protein
VLGAGLVIATLWAVACQGPTQVTLKLTTDVACDRVGPVAIATGKDAAEAAARADGATGSIAPCKAMAMGGSDLGTIVILPGRSASRFNVQVTLQIARPDGSGMDVVQAKRVITGFAPHRDAQLPIHLESACANVVCSDAETCSGGTCTSIPVLDPERDAGEPPPPPTDASLDVAPVTDAGACVLPLDETIALDSTRRVWRFESQKIQPDDNMTPSEPLAPGASLVASGVPGCPGSALQTTTAPQSLGFKGNGRTRWGVGAWVLVPKTITPPMTLLYRELGLQAWELRITANGAVDVVVNAPVEYHWQTNVGVVDPGWHRLGMAMLKGPSPRVWVDDNEVAVYGNDAGAGMPDDLAGPLTVGAGVVVDEVVDVTY